MNFNSLTFFSKFLKDVGFKKSKRQQRQLQKVQAQSSQLQLPLNAQQHLIGVFKAGLISGSLTAAGDCIAQALQSQQKVYEWQRSARMFGFGFVFYGPFQYWWYRALDKQFPGKSASTFLTKVALNQVILGPIVVSSIFLWTLTLTGKMDQIQQKFSRDLVSTVVNGWKFWVPAACLNFYLIPLNWRVLYMSCCGVVWAAYLSLASTRSQ